MKSVPRGSLSSPSVAVASSSSSGSSCFGAGQLFGSIDDPVQGCWVFKGRVVRAEALPPFREIVDRAGRVLRLVGGGACVRALEDEALVLVRSRQRPDTSVLGCDFCVREPEEIVKLDKTNNLTNNLGLYERADAFVPLREALLLPECSVLAVVARPVPDANGAVALADSSYTVMRVRLATKCAAGTIVALHGHRAVASETLLVPGPRATVTCYSRGGDPGHGAGLRKWWTRFGQAWFAREEQNQQMQQQQQHQQMLQQQQQQHQQLQKPRKQTSVLPSAKRLRPEEDDVPNSQDREFVASDHEFDAGEDDRVAKLIPKPLDKYEEQHLPESVRKYVADGHLLYDPYHDGALLRFEWSDRTVREVVRDLVGRNYIRPSETEKMRNALLSFSEGWSAWDAKK